MVITSLTATEARLNVFDALYHFEEEEYVALYREGFQYHEWFTFLNPFTVAILINPLFFLI